MAISPETLIPRIGDVLVEQGKITTDQLRDALELQKVYRNRGKAVLLGQILVELRMIDQESLNQSITQQIFILQNSLKEANSTLEQKVKERTEELELAYEKLSELTDLKANFISNVSHELRTPLTHINGYLDLLLSGKVDNLSKDQMNSLTTIKKAAGRLERLIEDLILFSTSETNKLVISEDKVDPISFIDEIIEHNLPIAQKKDIALSKNIEINTAMIILDRNKIQWVLNQLVDNAIKFTNPDGKISVTLVEKSEYFIFKVIDNGIGIATENLDEIFVPFHQLDGSSTRAYGGTGLGLALANKIITAHMSRLVVESTPGKGSTFSFAIKKP